jgi:hypothetical protein
MAFTSLPRYIPDNNIHNAETESSISGHFSTARDYASSVANSAEHYMAVLRATVSNLVPPDVTGIGDVSNPEVTSLDYIRRPRVSSIDINTDIPANTVSKPVFIDIPVVPSFNMPIMGMDVPQWREIERDAISELEKPGSPPSTGFITIPSAPSITLPVAPTLSDITIPSAPDSILPSFDAQRPSMELVLPESFSYNEPVYQSDLWTDVIRKILNDIRNGGTGLAIDIETGIWERAKETLREEKAKSIRQIESKLGSSGFDMPNGAIASAMLELESDWVKKTEDQINAIAIKQAELAQTNSHFILDQGVKCEGILRQFFNDQNNRILDASKQIALVGMEVFKATVDYHNAKVEQYKADAAVFEARVRAAAQEIELFKSKVEGSRVSAEVQALLIDIYQKQISAVESQIKIYISQMEGAKIQSDINKNTIEEFKTRVDAYAASMNIEKLKVDIYLADIEGEKIKSEVYKTQVEAFSARVGAESKRIDAGVSISSIAIEQNKAETELYKSELLGYTTEVDSILKKITAQVQGFQAEVSAYNAETSAEGSYYSVKEAEIRLLIENANHKLQKAIAEIDATTKGYIEVAKLKTEGTKAVADVSAQLAASAISSMHSSATMGFTATNSTNENFGYGQSIDENHNFSEQGSA